MGIEKAIETINEQITEAYKAGFIQGQLGNGTLHGELIDAEDGIGFVCSICGAPDESTDEMFSFCPRCGADMRGAE